MVQYKTIPILLKVAMYIAFNEQGPLPQQVFKVCIPKLSLFLKNIRIILNYKNNQIFAPYVFSGYTVAQGGDSNI